MHAILLLILGTIIGGAGQIAFASYTSFRDGIGLAIALKAEIESLLAVVEVRHYLADLDRYATLLEASAGPVGPEHIYAARIDDDYFGVFHSAGDKIGLLGNSSAPVVKAYVFAKAFLEDIRDLAELRDHPRPVGIDAPALALKVRGAQTVLAMAIDTANEAVAELRAFSQRCWPCWRDRLVRSRAFIKAKSFF